MANHSTAEVTKALKFYEFHDRILKALTIAWADEQETCDWCRSGNLCLKGQALTHLLRELD